MQFRKTMAVAVLGLAVPALTVACSTTQPVTSSVDDAGTTARVAAQLAADPDVDKYEIDVDTEQGVVHLRGEVETQAEKDEAERIARNTRGVRDVVNQIQLMREGAGSGPDWDAWVTTKVKSKLAVDPDIRAFNIDVDTENGIVYLTGIVEKEEDRMEAERLARGVEGVERVVNNLQLEDEAYPPGEGVDVEAQGPGEDEGGRRSR